MKACDHISSHIPNASAGIMTLRTTSLTLLTKKLCISLKVSENIDDLIQGLTQIAYDIKNKVNRHSINSCSPKKFPA